MSSVKLCIILSLVFGCLILGVFAQLYYFLWWKKRRTNLDIEIDEGNYAKKVFYFGCWKNTQCSLHNHTNPSVIRDQETTNHEQDLELGCDGKDMLLKSSGDESLELELMRLHNLPGPPRFLFTITEETKEDLESEDGKSKGERSRKGSRTKSLSDVMFTSLVSSPLKCSNLDTLDSYKHQGFNPLFEVSGESEFNRFRSSPPPKFKFLRDAEEKLYRKLLEESRRKALLENLGSVSEYEVENSTNNVTEAMSYSDGSFLRIVENKETESKQQVQQFLPQFPSGSSQVLPLTSSPTTFKPLHNSSMVHY
ncbi:uncharacterized protein [Cicer arietinum]|uniref:Uncharacterized protein LOC101511700 n=1 Tax=Cicer arietinum TaxID=3827 RepID=A0A1S2XC05_CICAR|nr:uncharacterized protein LOC101511700 [Cicer arietinum]